MENRAGEIRTLDLLNPIQALYQAEPRPDLEPVISFPDPRNSRTNIADFFVWTDEKNAKKGKVVSGGSTITQQLAKNLFLSGQRSYLRKGQEMIITYMLETMMDKRRILEIYLNVVEWGTGVFGAEAASMRYFGKPASALGAQEAARLAVMLPNPRYFGRHLDSGYLARRSNLILLRMRSAGLP